MQNKGIEFLENIVAYCEEIISFMKKINYDRETFLSNRMEQFGVSFCIEQIGDLVNNLSKEGYEQKYPELPWREIYGMRNRIAHGYFAVDLRIVFDTSVNDIPDLLQMCTEILEKETGLIYKIKDAEQQIGSVQNNAPVKENER